MITRTMLLAFAFLAAGCGKSACDELADCLGAENDGSADEDACETALDAAKEADLCD
jgi:hypothetical protein